MKKFLLSVSAVLVCFFQTKGQIISSTPALPTANDSVTIIFNAAGTPLQGYTGTVYTHTGVIVEGNSNWQYVIGDWGNNTTQPALTRLGTDLYQLKIKPTVFAFYGVPTSKKIQKMAFVFRSSNAQQQTDDLFINVVEAGTTLRITSPTILESLYDVGNVVNISVSANGVTSITLFINQTQVASTNNSTLNYSYTTQQTGTHKIKAVGQSNGGTISDSLTFYVRPSVIYEPMPDGIKPGVNITDNDQAILALWDPSKKKEFVFAIGDFSDWQATDWNYMKRTPDSLYHWVRISGLNPNQEYIYQYWIDGQLRIADPFTEKISDPWNDRYISATNYPGMLAYPENKTTGIASVFQISVDTYQWQTNNFIPPAKENLVIYELHIRDFVESDDIKDVIEKLDYLQDLGINAIELMPINEFEGNDSWGYNPSFYFATDKSYGRKNDYKRFIDECHARGIAVIIDLVLNHSFGQSPFVQMYFNANASQWGQPSADNPWYNQTCPHPPYCWGYDFNHASPHTQTLIDRINRFWIEEFRIDGFRFDFTKGFTNQPSGNDGSDYNSQRIFHLKRMADQIWAVKPNAYIILEHLCENSEEKELAEYRSHEGKGMMLWGNLNYNFNEATMGWVANSNLSGISYKSRGWNVPHLVGYMESHDEERLMYKNLQYGNSTNPNHDVKNLEIGLKRCELATTFFLAVPGPKMIWQFAELGYDVSIDYNGRTGRKPIRWHYINDPNRWNLHATYAKMIHLRHRFPVFQTNDFQTSLGGAQKWIKLNHPDMNAVVLGNFDVNSASFGFTFPHTGIWYEFFTQDSINVSQPSIMLTLAPGEYRLYTNRRIISDSIYVVGIKPTEKPFDHQIFVFPNPARSALTIEVETNTVDDIEMMLCDLTGRVVEFMKTRIIPGNNRVDIQGKNIPKQGVYLLMIQGQSLGNQTFRVIFE
ncbi:MAG TPA: alpha-amylase family glycosyl hydrolase [Salinivirgaceae bacterium]|nr:alpha-amylase family glycosyl hydrolase [Salinivirgaceae bacterium]